MEGNESDQNLEAQSSPENCPTVQVNNEETIEIEDKSPKHKVDHGNSNQSSPARPPSGIECSVFIGTLETELTQLRATLKQKDDIINLYEREKNILEKEKIALKKTVEQAVKEKENVVIRYATKEKSLIDAKRDKELAEKQAVECKKEVKIISSKYHLLNEEKSRLISTLDEKCNEAKRHQKDNEKLKTDINNLELKMKWQSIKLAQETEARTVAEKKLEEATLNPERTEQNMSAQHKIEQEATMILLKHENENKDKILESLKKELKSNCEKLKELQDNYKKEVETRDNVSQELEAEKARNNSVQNSLSQELLNSAKLRTQLEEMQVLQAKSAIYQDEINELKKSCEALEERVADSNIELTQLRQKGTDLLNINKEMTEKIVELQNEILLQNSKVKALNAENEALQKEKLSFDTRLNDLSTELETKTNKIGEERILLTKHLSEKTKSCETTKKKLDNALGDLEATKKKHSQVVKELQRELNKYKKYAKQEFAEKESTSEETHDTKSESSSIPNHSDSESETINDGTINMSSQLKEPSNKHLIDRILRLQQASARQAEKIDFLENHTMSLVSELQKKSKVLQYYMLRDQAGALTSSKSDQNKSELSKYGGVMSAIYSGLKGNTQSMTLELSLEINRKLQAVLEDTLLKNITLKENLDILGLEVDKLTRQIAQMQSNHSKT